jgi:hypothetical protein
VVGEGDLPCKPEMDLQEIFWNSRFLLLSRSRSEQKRIRIAAATRRDSR